MTRLLFIPLIGINLLASDCTGKTLDSPNIINSTDSTIAPVETKDPNADFKPAFVGQTRVSGVKTSAKYEVKILNEELSSPWGLTSLPDGRFLITEKAGNLRIVKQNGEMSAKITGLPAVDENGQGGLLGITLDPDFESNRMVYWAFSEKVSGGNHTSVAKGRLSNDESKIENASVIYRATPAHKGNLHFGGRVLFDKNGYLYLSTGERSDKVTRPQAQQVNSSLGKIIRITKDGQPAPGNALASMAGARPELFSYGHRNVQGLSLNPVDGELWSNEFGPRGGDEINHVVSGKNYGWPTITYGIEYAGAKIGDAIQQKEGMEQPIYYWDPSVSPSGMTFYSGNVIPEWQNNLFVGCLSGMHIARLVIKDNKVIGEERLLTEELQRFRDVHQGKDGALYAVTDQGRLYRIGN
ncbi:PQQ-dependent sugar dehydrogenase [Lacihabitans sp. LS3-19]|uniref:PQQ-dependent sugar dehydrogenase n=1 Tax=Lacihabitans sp. LS3-19 TaxID=2487335 RepID=UPI0020CF6777|nr:PQQ-dependent sugar dehydrogenase [Lacihabitans sp. LS3-19]MCP9770813.1 PQQ-dependent sugar dehydrogenase [Lacihabitans sp. LS3-19]